MDYSTPIRDRLAFRGLTLTADEIMILDKKCKVSTYEPYMANDGDGAIVTIFDFGYSERNQYFAIEKSSHYKFFLIGYELLSDGGSIVNNISSLPNDDLSTAVNILTE